MEREDKKPTKKLKNHFDKLKDSGFTVIIFSNSPRNRLEPFKKYLNVDCCPSARKPRKAKFIKVLKEYKLDLSEVAIIGDQLVTDIYGGNRVGITTVLVNPMSDIDMPFTKIIDVGDDKVRLDERTFAFFAVDCDEKIVWFTIFVD